MALYHCIFGLSILVFIFSISFGDNGDDEPYQCNMLYKFIATSSNTSGDIYSPFYEKGEYPNDLWCEYRITAPVGYRLKLTFKDIDIDPSDFCNDDTLDIYANEKESLITSVCGTDIPDPIITDSDVHVVQLVFKTDDISSGRGFHIHYDASPSFEYCTTGLEECANKKCFDPTSQKCNGVDDCGDGSDEEECKLPLSTSECGDPPIVPYTIYEGRAADRIIGGQEAIPGSWPWQVSLQRRYSYGSSHSCGGSLVNAQWVVTAAHCFKSDPDAKNWRVHVGKHHKYFKDKTEQIRYGTRIIVWPNLTGDHIRITSDLTHDAALLKLNAPVQFSDAVRPACLPMQDFDLSPGTLCYATGWGETRGTGSNHVLKQTDVSIMSSSNCMFVETAQICVQNRKGLQATCHGDSGGPLSCKISGRWYVMGATSFGTMSNFLSGLCAMPDQKTVFMKMSAKSDWVHSMIKYYSQ